MQHVRLTLETVTPLFLAGAEPRGAPELRAPSIRGALRFWLRALLGGVMGDNDLDGLRQAEAGVFGSTDAGASPVVTRITNARCGNSVSFSQLAQWNSKSYGLPGIAYLFFAVRGTKRERERQALPPKSRFELELGLRAGMNNQQDALSKAYASLWLLTHLGGLGTRSRRGAGSLQVTQVHRNIPDATLPPLEVQATTPRGLQKELKVGLLKLRAMINGTSPVVIHTPSAFDILHPDSCKIWVLDRTFHSWKEALNSLGSHMQQFRLRRSPDYENVKRAIQGQPLEQPVQRAAFGLPIIFYYRSLRGAKGSLQGERHDRRASPLIVRVTRLANEQYVLVLTFFQAQLLEAGEKLKLKRPKPSAFVPPPDFSIINTFIKETNKNFAPCLEVGPW